MMKTCGLQVPGNKNQPQRTPWTSEVQSDFRSIVTEAGRLICLLFLSDGAQMGLLDMLDSLSS